jgi:hypothetical protein
MVWMILFHYDFAAEYCPAPLFEQKTHYLFVPSQFDLGLIAKLSFTKICVNLCDVFEDSSEKLCAKLPLLKILTILFRLHEI